MKLTVTGRELTVLAGTIVTYLHVPFHGVAKSQTAPACVESVDLIYERLHAAKEHLFVSSSATRTEEERLAAMSMSANIELSRAEIQLLIAMLGETADWLGSDDYHAGLHIGRYVTTEDLRCVLGRLVSIQN